MHYCFLQHRTLHLSPVISTTGCCFCFGSIPLFLLELFLHCSPVAYWAPTDLRSSSFSILSFCLFILFMGFSRQEYWSGLPFPSPVDHILDFYALDLELFSLHRSNKNLAGFHSLLPGTHVNQPMPCLRKSAYSDCSFYSVVHYGNHTHIAFGH